MRAPLLSLHVARLTSNDVVVAFNPLTNTDNVSDALSTWGTYLIVYVPSLLSTISATSIDTVPTFAVTEAPPAKILRPPLSFVASIHSNVDLTNSPVTNAIVDELATTSPVIRSNVVLTV